MLFINAKAKFSTSAFDIVTAACLTTSVITYALTNLPAHVSIAGSEVKSKRKTEIIKTLSTKFKFKKTVYVEFSLRQLEKFVKDIFPKAKCIEVGVIGESIRRLDELYHEVLGD